jgi:hypothetical protein
MPTLNFAATADFADRSAVNERRILGYTGPSSYVTGGDSLPPGSVKLGRIKKITFGNPTNGTVILLVAFDYTNNLVKWFDLAGAEIANGTDLSTYSTRMEVIGT